MVISDGSKVFICVLSKGHLYYRLSIALENEPWDWYQLNLVCFHMALFSIPGIWGVWCFSVLLEVRFVVWLTVAVPSSHPSSGFLQFQCPPEAGHWLFANPQAQRLGGCRQSLPPCTHAHSPGTKRIVFLLISTQAPPELMGSFCLSLSSRISKASFPFLFLVTCSENSQGFIC
jgi:hypothetical protein